MDVIYIYIFFFFHFFFGFCCPSEGSFVVPWHPMVSIHLGFGTRRQQLKVQRRPIAEVPKVLFPARNAWGDRIWVGDCWMMLLFLFDVEWIWMMLMLKNLGRCFFCFVFFWLAALYVCMYAFVSLHELPGPPPEPPDLTASDFEPMMEDIGDRHRSVSTFKMVSRMNSKTAPCRK